jgi:transcriptional regulator with XRE-family HTH domain
LDKDDLYRRLAREIRDLREAEGLSQGDLASLAGVTRAQLANIEGLRQRPPIDVIYRLAVALKVDLNALLPPLRDLSARVAVDFEGQTRELPPGAARFLRNLRVNR